MTFLARLSSCLAREEAEGERISLRLIHICIKMTTVIMIIMKCFVNGRRLYK